MAEKEPRPTSMTYSIVYDIDSGDVLHVHVEPVELGTSADELRQIVTGRERRLDVLQRSSDEIPDRPFRVSDGELDLIDEAADFAGGGVARQFATPAIDRQYRPRSSPPLG